jgi:outer membrane immunogenic protein
MKVLSKLNALLAGSAAVAVAAIGTAGVAQADAYERAPRVVYERPASWSGVYFGLHSGYAWTDTDATFIFSPPQGYGVSHDAPIVGGQVGINWQLGQFVVGVEGSLSSAFRNDPGITLCPNPTLLCTERFDDVITVGGRLGWAVGKYLPYATGGYANAAFSHESVSAFTLVPNLQSRDRHSGWYVGGGVDYIIAPSWTFGIEYRHYELDDVISVPHTPAGVPALASSKILDTTLDTVTARVSWKWDWTGGGMK